MSAADEHTLLDEGRRHGSPPGIAQISFVVTGRGPPPPTLCGGGPPETAFTGMGPRRAEMMVATPMMMAVRHLNPRMAALEQQVAAIGEQNLAGGTRALGLLDRRLAESEWLGAARLTIADIVAFVGIDFGRMIKFQIPEELTHVARWADAMRARPAASAGMPARPAA